MSIYQTYYVYSVYHSEIYATLQLVFWVLLGNFMILLFLFFKFKTVIYGLGGGRC